MTSFAPRPDGRRVVAPALSAVLALLVVLAWPVSSAGPRCAH